MIHYKEWLNITILADINHTAQQKPFKKTYAK